MRRLLLAILVAILAAPSLARPIVASEGIPFYKHTAFPTSSGAPGGVNALAQTPDGMLWIGTQKGLYRFDGSSFERVLVPDSLPRRSLQIQSLLADRSGVLWIGHNWGGVETLRNGRFEDRNQGHHYAYTAAIVEAADGAVWAMADGLAFTDLQIYRNYRRHDATPFLPVSKIHGYHLVPEPDGTIWLGLEGPLARLRRGEHRFTLLGSSNPYSAAIAIAPDGRPLSIGADGLRYALPDHGAKSEPIMRFPDGLGQFIATRGTQRDLWIAVSGSGIYRVDLATSNGNARAWRFAAKDLTSPLIGAMLVDREGSVWVGTERGLDQFTPALFNEVLPTTAVPANANPLWDGAELIGSSGGSFIVKVSHSYFRPTPDGGLAPIAGMQNLSERPCLDEQGDIFAVRGSSIGRLDGGISHPMPSNERVPDVDKCRVADRGRRIYVVNDTGLYRLAGQKWTRVRLAPEFLNDPPINVTLRTPDEFLAHVGNVAVFHISGNKRTTLFRRANNPVTYVNVIVSTPSGFLLGGTDGLARYNGRKLQVLDRARYPFFDEVVGMARGTGDTFWVMATAGLIKLRADELDAAFNHPGVPLHADIFGLGDGLDANVLAIDTNGIATDPTGRVWLATDHGIYIFDPDRRADRGRAPPLSITSVDVDGKAFPTNGEITLPPGPNDVRIRFMVGSLRNPIKIQSRYRLIGLGSGWIDPGTAKEAIYTHLPPGRYEFQVIAADANGHWNRAGASLRLRVPPTFVQSWWFTALCCLAVLIIVAGLYRARLAQHAANLRAKIEARSSERERIARELHDTLLQGVQALIIGMQNVADDLPSEAPQRGRMLLELDRADHLLAEGRDRVHDLRSSEPVSLESALASVGSWHSERSRPKVRFSVEGAPRAVRPEVSVEVTRIVEEALTNVHQHARAENVVVTVDYGLRALTVQVQDDGVGGVSDDTIERRRAAGHFGVTGMRERAAKIGATWKIAEAAGGGTLVTLRVPGKLAYAHGASGLLGRLRFARAASD